MPPNADPITVAALANPTASSWMALQCRAIGGCRSRIVAILGATSANGRSAAFVARYLGASRVIGAGRSESALQTVQGLDAYFVLKDPFDLPNNIGPVHVVLDYVGGPTAIDFMRAVQILPGENLQHIQIGGLAGHDTLVVPSRLINVKPILVMASGVGSLSAENLKSERKGLVGAISSIERPFDVFTASMPEVHSVWESEENDSKRLVLVP